MNPSSTLSSRPLAETLLRISEVLGEHARRVVQEIEPVIHFEAPRRREFGDFSTNLAFGLAKAARKAPAQIAELIVQSALQTIELKDMVATLEATAGFINIRLAPQIWLGQLQQILGQREAFGRNSLAGSPRVSLEFGSANPTGPLVVVQGRTLSVGETIAKALKFCGIPVTTEWIINDAGNQLETFGRSIYARYRQITDPAYLFPENGYPGEYVYPIAQNIRERDGNRWESLPEAEWLPIFSQLGRDTMVADQQKICARFGVTYDLWQSEVELHAAGAVTQGIASLTTSGLTYTFEGALWFSATQFGDDKDRVLTRSDGRPTYYAGDVAYHHSKYQRGAKQIIDILGPDHHGYIGRLQALAAALGHPGSLEVLIVQQMTLMRGNEQVSMSKRAGHILTLEEVIDEVGIDAARFFFVLSSTDSPLTFDLELAKKASDENPVYYVQYGHARIASLLRKAPVALSAAAEQGLELDRLGETSELALIRRLAELPSVVEQTAMHRAPHRLAKYARDIAADYHQCYAEHRVLSDDEALTTARLGLALATKCVLSTVLTILGVSSPESM